jgi:hypothetical protein
MGKTSPLLIREIHSIMAKFLFPIYLLLLILLALSQAWATDTISIDTFRSMGPMERERAIEQAPPEEKEQLEKVNLRLNLLARWHGEEGLKIAKETQAYEARGLGNLAMLFTVQSKVWNHYVSAVLDGNEKAGLSREAQIVVEEKLLSERDALRSRLPAIHSLILNMAASPGAMTLDKKAALLAEQWSIRLQPKSGPITKKERLEVDQRANEVLEETKQLPKLSRLAVQKEVDAVTGDKVRWHGFIHPLYLSPAPPGQSGYSED